MRIFQNIFVLSFTVFLIGCASQIMESYVGKSIVEPMLDYGRPVEVFDIGPNKRAYQWEITSSGVVPITTPTTATIYGSGGWANVTTTTTTYSPYSKTCRYTLLASRAGEEWIVDGFRKPKFGCE